MKFLHIMFVWRALVTASLCLLADAALAQSLEIIELRFRTAQEVIPVLQPLLEPGGALSGADYKLFVRASSANLAQLRAAVAALDRQPRQLSVSVRRSSRQELERENASAAVVIGKNSAAVTATATDSAAQRADSGVMTVQVLEGNAAHVAVGASVPIVTAVAAGGAHRPWIAGTTTHRDLSSGFLVTPRLSGEQVMLDISQQSERRDGHSNSIESQHLSTQVSGRLGEWISLGGISESSSSQQSRILGRQYATQSDELGIWVKVEER